MALVCLGAQRWIFGNLAHMAFVPKAVGVIGTIGIAAAVFGVAVAVLKVDEVNDVIHMAKRKLGRQ